MDRNDRELVDWLRTYAAGLRYNSPDGVLKQQLHSAATTIAKAQVTIMHLNGQHLIGAPGQEWRQLTWRERLALWLLQDKTEIRP